MLLGWRRHSASRRAIPGDCSCPAPSWERAASTARTGRLPRAEPLRRWQRRWRRRRRRRRRCLCWSLAPPPPPAAVRRPPDRRRSARAWGRPRCCGRHRCPHGCGCRRAWIRSYPSRARTGGCPSPIARTRRSTDRDAACASGTALAAGFRPSPDGRASALRCRYRRHCRCGRRASRRRLRRGTRVARRRLAATARSHHLRYYCPR